MQSFHKTILIQYIKSVRIYIIFFILLVYSFLSTGPIGSISSQKGAYRVTEIYILYIKVFSGKTFTLLIVPLFLLTIHIGLFLSHNHSFITRFSSISSWWKIMFKNLIVTSAIYSVLLYLLYILQVFIHGYIKQINLFFVKFVCLNFVYLNIILIVFSLVYCIFYLYTKKSYLGFLTAMVLPIIEFVLIQLNFKIHLINNFIMPLFQDLNYIINIINTFLCALIVLFFLYKIAGESLKKADIMG